MNYNPNDNDYEKPPSLYNGRINLMTKSANETAITMDNHENAFLMQDRIPVKSNDYNNALQGEIQNTMLSVAFFSKENQDIIQKISFMMIRESVNYPFPILSLQSVSCECIQNMSYKHMILYVNASSPKIFVSIMITK